MRMALARFRRFVCERYGHRPYRIFDRLGRLPRCYCLVPGDGHGFRCSRCDEWIPVTVIELEPARAK